MTDKSSQRKTLIAGIALFLLLAAIYLFRAVRDETAMVAGVENLRWLISLTFGLLCLLSLLLSFSTNAAKTHLLYITVLCLAMLALSPAKTELAYETTFAIIGASNLILVSQYWKVLTNRFSKAEATRSYPAIMLTGSIGVIVGPYLVTRLHDSGTNVMVIVAIACLLTSTLLLLSIKPGSVQEKSTPSSNPPQAKAWPLASLILVYSVLGTILYGEHLNVLEQTGLSSNERLLFFGERDLWIGCITLLLQLVNHRFSHLGLAQTGFRLMPIVTWSVLLIIGFFGSLEAVLWSMVLFRSFNYAYVRPAREIYYFNSLRSLSLKTLLDTVIYRIGDLLGIWLFQLLLHQQFDYLQIGLLLSPLILGWVLLNKKIVKTLNA